MKNDCFCNLHVHSEYSTQDSLCKIKSLVEKCKIEGFKYCSITDHGNINGSIKFTKECIGNNIIPIIGQEYYIVENIKNKPKGEKRNHLIVLCKNNIGWRNINKMNTISNLEGHYYRPRIDPNILLNHSEGLIFSTACVSSFVNTNWGLKLLDELVNQYNGDVYGEIQPHQHSLQYSTNELILKLKHKYNNFKLIATQDSHYINREDKSAHDVLLTIESDKLLSDPSRWQFSKGFECYFPTSNEIVFDFIKQDQLDRKTYLNAIHNTIEVAEKCAYFKLGIMPMSLPKVPNLNCKDEDLFLKQLCFNGLNKKNLGNDKKYTDRIEMELKTISDKGFSRYFLIIWDLFEWMHNNDILTNCRGSVGNSLVAHVIGITNIDPLQHNLPFSRFINEERNDLPDIDVDTVDDRREDVINRLRELYGENNIGNISTFGFLKDKSAIRDVCRVREINLDDVNKICKEIKNDEIPEDSWFNIKYPVVKKDVSKLKGTVRNLGVHAAGIILSDFDLRNGDRCSLVYGKKDALTVNWDKYDAEYCGLIKFDLLGVKKLTVIRECIKLINDKFNVGLNYNNFDMNDKKVFDAMTNGETIGSFQLSGFATTEISKQMGIEEFKHIVHAVSLSRPGPRDSGMTEEYINRKHGNSWDKKHPLYEEMLKDTYGIICFQDDVINIINKVAGLPYSTADRIRSIIGKKRDVSEFKPYREQFVQGCLNQKTLNEDESNSVWDGFEKHALYSFNRAHATFYAILAYKTMWLKVNYPAEFMCASLSYDNKEIKPDLITESKRLGLKILPPKIGISDPLKWKTQNNILYTPFNEIRGIGEKTLSKLESKSDGFFTSDSNLIKGKMKKILDDIKAYDKDEPLPLTACSYFDIDICNDYKSKYPNLIKLYGDSFDDARIYDLLHGNVEIPNLEIEYDSSIDISEIVSCKACELHKECKHKVLPSLSNNRIMILGEAAYIDEHEKGYPFAGKSGKTLWNEFKRYNLKRDDFNVVNSVMCAVLKSKNPKQIHIDACKIHVEKYIQTIRPVIVLVLGNWSRYYITGELSGIMKANATIEWNESIGAFVAYCLHPSSVWRGIDNAKMFSEGVEFFSNKLDELGIF